MSMQVHVGWQVAPFSGAPTVSSARNGPPDIKTIDRRRVDPPAGCRATTEPATVAGRRSAERDNWRTTEEQPNSAQRTHCAPQPNIELFAATGRSRVGTSSGLAVSGAGQGAARRPFDSRAPLMRIRRRGAGAAAVMQLGCISSCGGSSRTSIHHARTSILSLVPLPVMQPKRITDGTSPLRRSVCITFTGTRSA